MIRAVLFDLDGTLYDRDGLAAALFEEQNDAFAADLRAVARDLADVLAICAEYGAAS